MIAGNASFFPGSCPTLLSLRSSGLENMISFVPGVYSGATAAAREAGKGLAVVPFGFYG